MDNVLDIIGNFGFVRVRMVVTLFKYLMQIPSTTEEEHEIGVFLNRYLSDLGYTVESIPIAPGSPRCNIYAYMGNSPQARVCLTSHMDTAAPYIPPRLTMDVFYGRGACDDKSAMAAQITAVEELRMEQHLQNGDVSFLFVVGGMSGGEGMKKANDMGRSWDAVIFGEPTGGKLAVAEKGHYVFELVSHGVPVHSGYPGKGLSAISTMVALLSDLEKIKFPTSSLNGSSTFHCGRINGGTEYNTFAAECTALCSIRISCEMEQVEKMVGNAVAKYPGVELTKQFIKPEVNLDHYIPALLNTTVAFDTDVRHLKGNHEQYLYGPGLFTVAQGQDEQIAVEDLLKSVEVYKNLVKHCLLH